MDGKSILLANLPDDPRIQTKIIIDTFERFYRIPESTLNLGGELQRDENFVLSESKKKLKKVITALSRPYYPFLDLKELCQDMIRLDTKALDKFKLKWNDKRLANFCNTQSISSLDIPEFVQSLLKLYGKNADELKLEWDNIKETCKQHEKLLDEKYGSVIRPKELIERWIQVANDLNAFKLEWPEIEETLTPIVKSLHPPSEISKLVEDLKQTHSKIIEKHKLWIGYSTTLLQDLAKDILLVKDVGVEGWNYEILKEVIYWIRFICEFFVELEHTLALPHLAEKRFGGALEDVEIGLFELIEGFLKPKENEINSQDIPERERGMVSAKTVRELYILNELSKQLLNGHLRVDEQLDIQKLANDIDTVLKKLPDRVRKLENDTVEGHQSKTDERKTRKGLTWIPNMIAVVLDSNTRFLLTGATQPDCKRHPVLREAASKIPHWQVGREFAPRIAGCYDFWKKNNCVEMRGRWSKELETLAALEGDAKEKYSKALGKRSDQELETLFPKEKPREVYNQLPAPEKGSKIMSWAVSGHDFELKSPCPRCAYFYSSWDLHKTDEFSNSAYLLNYLNGGMADAKKDKEFHCAETVAAAKIYAWRHETLGFSGCNISAKSE